MIRSPNVLNRIEKRLSAILSATDQSPMLLQAMSYSALSGGKRIRPLLAIATGKLSCANPDTVTTIACALELIHCYSLIHDDLPAMDNDDLRRGIPTCHIKYDEATAILAGDALQTLAFEVLSQDTLQLETKMQLRIINLIACASGVSGMVLGQALDVINGGNKITQVELQYMHSLKTGCLIKAAILAGYLCGTKIDEAIYLTLDNVANLIGLLFQITDDILDATENSATLGKTANKDVLQEKATYVSILSLEVARHEAQMLYTQILTILQTIEDSEDLVELVELVYNRHH